MPKTPKNPTDRKYIMLGIRIVGDFGATLAVPVIVLVLIAQWLEGKYGGSPWLTILAFILAATFSAISIKRKAERYQKDYLNIENKEKQNQIPDLPRRQAGSKF